MQFITGVRVERAREFLETTDLSVAAISKNVGYEDSQYFFRVFKKVTGMTPLKYRQVARSGGE
jgi:YesN/AraC family two-component response regulator